MRTAIHLLIAFALIALAAGGIALFWIARQDDSRLGRILGLAALVLAAIGVAYVGHRL